MASATLRPPLPGGAGGGEAPGDAPPATGPCDTTSPSTLRRRRSLAERLGDWTAALRARLKYGPGAADVGWLSSRLVAARRAMESQDEPVPLFHDPLAQALVGRKVMRAARAGAKAGRPGVDAKAGGGTGGAAATGRSSPASRIAARTLWFDAEVEAAAAGVATSAVAVRLSVEGAKRGAVSPPVRVAIAPVPHPPAAQAVCLGAGMDTRPWRGLAGAGRLAWFEVDAPHVLAAKAAALRAAAAEAPPWDGQAGAVRLEAGSSGGGGGGGPTASWAFPLTVRSYAALAADLGAPGWGDRLVRSCAYDPAAPTLFLAEGLVMYLSAAGVGCLLTEAAAVAAPGSVLAVVAATEAATAAAQARSNGRGILAAWTWGCPPDPAAFWADHGWAVQGVATRSDIARRWGLAWTEFPVAPASPGGAGRADRESLFIVAMKQ